MKTFLFPSIFIAAYLSVLGAARIDLGPFPNEVSVGESYILNWTASKNYNYTLLLVNETEYGWSEVETLFDGRVLDALEGSYTWKVEENLTSGSGYGLWLDGNSIPYDLVNGTGYANLSHWFTVETSRANFDFGGTSDTHQKRLSGGEIAGIVVGAVVGLVLLVGAVAVFVKRRHGSAFKQREAADRADRLAPVMQEKTVSL